MKSNSFFYYSQGEKRGILLLLILIALSFVAHLLWQKDEKAPAEIRESDSLRTAFEQFQKTLIEEEQEERNRFYDEQRRANYERRKAEYAERWQRYQDENKDSKKPDFPTFAKQEKLSTGQTIAINNADTSALKTIPGIGSGFARSIVKYRDRLGGFSHPRQLMEVYGFTEERYAQVSPYVTVSGEVTPLKINSLSQDQLSKHPYLNFKQAKAIVELRHRRGKLQSVKQLQMLDEFSDADIQRLTPYLSFE